MQHSPRVNKDQYNNYICYINEVFLSIVDPLNDLDRHHGAEAYNAELQTNMDIFTANITHPTVYQAKLCAVLLF